MKLFGLYITVQCAMNCSEQIEQLFANNRYYKIDHIYFLVSQLKVLLEGRDRKKINNDWPE